MPRAKTPPNARTPRPKPGKKRDCGPGPGIRPSKNKRWRAIVLLGVHGLIALHIAHYMSTGRSLSPLEPSEAMRFTKDGVVNAGLVFFALAIVATAIFGRWFCGWACHLVALQDLCAWMLGKLGIKPKPLRSRALLIVPFAAFFYMFLYPLAYRLWHGLGWSIRGTELQTTEFWATFPPWPIALATFAFSGFAIIYFLGAKGFCTYACPYGAIFAVTDRLAPWRIRVTDACEGCGHCTATCTSNVEVHAEVRDYGAVIDPACMKCLDCVSVCPKDALYFGVGRPEILTRRRSPVRGNLPARVASRWKAIRWKQVAGWEELLLAFSFAAAFLAFRGLYGMVPFLFSLAIAGILAFLTLQTVRALVRRNVSMQRLTVKADGRITKPGKVFLLAMAALGVFWLHSGAVQFAAWRLERGWMASEALRRSWFGAPDSALTDEERTQVERTISAGLFLERRALLVDARTPVRIASLKLLTGDEEEFLRRMERAIAEDPDDASLLIGMGEYEAARGRSEAALATLGRAIELAPENSTFVLRAIIVANGIAPLERVEGLLESALVRHPDHAGLLLHLGQLRLEAGQLDAAALSLSASVAADPRAPQSRDLLALTLKMSGRHREAISQYQELRTLRPQDQDPVFQIADSAARLRDYELAERTLRELEAEAPTIAHAWALLAQLAHENGDPAVAARFFALAVELDPSLARPQ